MIFKGSIHNLRDIVFYYSGGSNGQFSIVEIQSGLQVWCFDYPSGQFQVKQGEGGGYPQAALAASGKPWELGSPKIRPSIDESMVQYALIPI